MSRKNHILEQLLSGEIVTWKPTGNSMSGKIESRDQVVIRPVNDLTEINIGDVVYCEVRGNYLLHLVTAIDAKGRYQISNNHGHVNGWTKQIYGVVVSINADKKDGD